VARLLEAAGHDLIIADPGFSPMYAHRHRRSKTDKRDAFVLAQASRLGAYRTSHRATDESRHLRALLAAREVLVASRARMVVLSRALFRRRGIRLATGGTEHFARRVGEAVLPPDLQAELAPLQAVLQTITEQIAKCDTDLAAIAQQHAPTRLLTTMPCVAAVTAATFACVIDDASRFRGGHHVSAYLGLVPREYSSGETRRLGGITKAGNARLRSLLVQAALRIRRCKPPSMQDLVDWSESIAARRGKKVAIVALARRLAGVLWAMMHTNTPYLPATVRRRAAAAA
jgi:transposase